MEAESLSITNSDLYLKTSSRDSKQISKVKTHTHAKHSLKVFADLKAAHTHATQHQLARGLGPYGIHFKAICPSSRLLARHY